MHPTPIRASPPQPGPPPPHATGTPQGTRTGPCFAPSASQGAGSGGCGGRGATGLGARASTAGTESRLASASEGLAQEGRGWHAGWQRPWEQDRHGGRPRQRSPGITEKTGFGRPPLSSGPPCRRGGEPSPASGAAQGGGKKNPPPQPSQRPPVPEHPSPAGARGGNRGTERRRLTADGKARQRGEKN